MQDVIPDGRATTPRFAETFIGGGGCVRVRASVWVLRASVWVLQALFAAVAAPIAAPREPGERRSERGQISAIRKHRPHTHANNRLISRYHTSVDKDTIRPTPSTPRELLRHH